MQQMLVDLLDASRREHVEVAPQPRDVPVADVLQEVVSGLRSADHGVVIRHTDERVHADPVHLRRITANLIDNARKYGAPPVEVSAHQDGQQVHIRVRDHGGGVPDTFVPRLFDPFAQAHPESQDVSGIGLGLSIVHELARQNGGTVTYEPATDGACFVVTLPTAKDQSSHVE
jgi:signal transduction histidine kinase